MGLLLPCPYPVQHHLMVVKSGKGSSVVQVDGFYQLWVKHNLPAAIIVKDVEPVIVSSAVVVGSTMVDMPGENPFDIIEDGDYVEVDADSEEIRVWKGGKKE